MKDPRFPELNNRQIQILKSYGEIETFSERKIVFKRGETFYDFFVILEGELSIEDHSHQEIKIITIHKKNEFSGDSGMISNRGAQFDAYTKAGTKLLRIKPAKLKEVIGQHGDIGDKLLNAFLLRQQTILADHAGGIEVLGSGNSGQTYAIRDFLEKNHIWYNFVDIDQQKDAKEMLEHFEISHDELPILINGDAKVCKNPSIEQLARYTGVLTDFADKIFDVLVIGAGPAGLAASVYAGSEGLSVVTIDSNAPGGQAGKSSKIENYLGFPTGISGSDLANRALIQAQKFGCSISIPHIAKKVEKKENYFKLYATNGKEIRAKTIIAATGADYRKLPLSEIEKYEGSGVYYSATRMHSNICKGGQVGIVGGGNSAGQAALFLSEFAKEVHIMIRGEDLGAKMSLYLIQRIVAAENIHLHTKTEVSKLHGEYHLEGIEITNSAGAIEPKSITNLFTFIGAKPRTEWLTDFVQLDKPGFIFTGTELTEESRSEGHPYTSRSPFNLETSVPGVFAVGDVRHGSVKRVASAVGEGAMVVSQIHQYLSTLQKA